MPSSTAESYKTFLPQTNNQLRTSSNPRNQATVQDGRVVVQNVQGRQNRGQGNNARGAGAAGYGGAQNRVGNANPGQARQVKCYNCNGRPHSKELHSTQAPKLLNTSKTRLVADASSRDGVVLIRAVNYTKYMKPPRECRDDVKPSYIVGSHADYTRNSNNEIHRIQYVKGPTHYRYTKAKSVYGVQISDLDLSA
ncbi:hypothetical protein Tco_0375470 [Tanacetum coccineum]